MKQQGKSDESAKRICGKLQAEAEGKYGTPRRNGSGRGVRANRLRNPVCAGGKSTILRKKPRPKKNEIRHIWMPLHYNKKSGDITALLTNDSLDRDEERMSDALIERYHSQVKETGLLPMLIDHKNEIDSLTGYWKNPRLVKENGMTGLVMNPSYFSDKANPRATQIQNMVKEAADMGAGIGVSIGARPLKSHSEKEGNKNILIWDDAELLEASYTPIPSNKFAFTNIAKKFKTSIFGDTEVKNIKKLKDSFRKSFGDERMKKQEDENVSNPEEDEKTKQEENGELDPTEELASIVEALISRVTELEDAVFEKEEETEEEDMDKETDEEDKEEEEENTNKTAEDNEQEPEEPHEDTGEAKNEDGVGVLEEGSTATPGKIVDDEKNPKEEGKPAPGATKSTKMKKLQETIKRLEKQMKEPVYKPLYDTSKPSTETETSFNANKAIQLLSKR